MGELLYNIAQNYVNAMHYTFVLDWKMFLWDRGECCFVTQQWKYDMHYIALTLEKQELFNDASVSHFTSIPPGSVDATTGEN